LSDRDAPFLSYGRQSIDDEDVAAVVEVLRGEFLTTGPAVPTFEAAVAETVGAPHAVACSSGTAALHLAALALDFAPGDRAIVPSLTFVATANAMRYVGAEVVFADCDPETALMGPEHLDQALARARAEAAGPGALTAVFPVHMAGQCAAPDEIADLARRHGLRVVTDACHALGTRYGGADGRATAVGACRHEDMAVFSFHPLKTVTMGEGGVVTTPDPEVARRLRRLRSHGLEREAASFVARDRGFAADGKANPWYYELRELGFNYRASDIHCALGRSQIKKLSRLVARRRALVAHYDSLIAGLAPTIRPIGRAPNCTPAWHLYGVLIDFAAVGLDRATVMTALRGRGIGTQVHYVPVHRQPYYRDRYGALELPGTEAYYARCLSLPLHPNMAESDVERVVDGLVRVVMRNA
jgi:UDP-4-amino-4,6-dideoxy-N-acetyl-beta-L-altrosamine transaminase